MYNSSLFASLVHDQARMYKERVALSYRDYDADCWRDISWVDFSKDVRRVSRALVSLGIGEQENIGVFSQNKPECLITDFGAYGVRAVTIPFYATSSEHQVTYMVRDAGIRMVLVGEQYQYDTLWRVQGITHSIEHIVVFDPKVERNPMDRISISWEEFLAMGDSEEYQTEVDKRTAAATVDDLINILYTSGTTGEPKGVMLTMRMYAAGLKGNDEALPTLSDQDRVLNFLPFTHVFERAWSYLCVSKGAHLFVNLRPQDVQKSMQEVHPTCMCSVPRFWEKVYAGVKERINTSPAMQRKIMTEAIEVCRDYNVKYKLRGLVAPFHIRLRYLFYEKTVISLLKKALGLENVNFFPTAGAYVSEEIEEFIHAAGIFMMVGYGLTESTATVSNDHIGEPVTLGSVGRIIRGLEVKIDEENQNEVLLRGDTITPGYYNKPAETAKAIDKDGWFHTGDAGYIKNGELFLTERIKDLFKTSNGKYIAPQMIEGGLVVDRFIDQVVVIANERKFVSALIIPEYKLLSEWAAEEGIAYKDMAELCANERTVQMVLARIQTLQQGLAYYEQVKRITLLPEPFSIENGEVTNTLKVKRSVVNQHYAEVIEKMYEE